MSTSRKLDAAGEIGSRRCQQRRILSSCAAALALTALSAGCGTARPPGSPAGKAGGTGSVAKARADSTGRAAGAALPGIGPVPAHFAARSVTFVSPDEGFVLGTAPCAARPCTSLVRTLNRGATWVGLPAPLAKLGGPGDANAVWGIRFATASHGFIFGSSLWETTDGGEHWVRDARPASSVIALAIVRGEVIAVTQRCTPANGCPQTGWIVRRALSGGPWTTVIRIHPAFPESPTDLIGTQAGIAAILNGTSVVVSHDGGVRWTSHPTPCTSIRKGRPTSVAVIAPNDLALLCTGEGFLSHTLKFTYLSQDDGAHWTATGKPSAAGDGGTIAAASLKNWVISTASAASWLYYSGNEGSRWHTVVFKGDGGFGWADLGFTTLTNGIVVYGPARSDGNPEHFPGQLWLTSNGGSTWHAVTF
jgi:hypothetical protein